jgi:hypothetical protein
MTRFSELRSAVPSKAGVTFDLRVGRMVRLNARLT